MPKPRDSKEFTAFAKLTDRLFSVPRSVIQERLNAHREQAAQNPNRRGPKRKDVTPSASSEPAHDDAEAS